MLKKEDLRDFVVSIKQYFQKYPNGEDVLTEDIDEWETGKYDGFVYKEDGEEKIDYADSHFLRLMGQLTREITQGDGGKRVSDKTVKDLVECLTHFVHASVMTNMSISQFAALAATNKQFILDNADHFSKMEPSPQKDITDVIFREKKTEEILNANKIMLQQFADDLTKLSAKYVSIHTAAKSANDYLADYFNHYARSEHWATNDALKKSLSKQQKTPDFKKGNAKYYSVPRMACMISDIAKKNTCNISAYSIAFALDKDGKTESEIGNK